MNQRHHCVTKTGNMAHVDTGTYNISQWWNRRAPTEGGIGIGYLEILTDLLQEFQSL